MDNATPLQSVHRAESCFIGCFALPVFLPHLPWSEKPRAARLDSPRALPGTNIDAPACPRTRSSRDVPPPPQRGDRTPFSYVITRLLL